MFLKVGNAVSAQLGHEAAQPTARLRESPADVGSIGCSFEQPAFMRHVRGLRDVIREANNVAASRGRFDSGFELARVQHRSHETEKDQGRAPRPPHAGKLRNFR